MIEEQEKRPKEEGRKKGRFQNCNFHPKKREREGIKIEEIVIKVRFIKAWKLLGKK